MGPEGPSRPHFRALETDGRRWESLGVASSLWACSWSVSRAFSRQPHLPAVRGAIAAGLLILGGLKIRGNTSPAAKPWRLVLAAGAVALLSAVIRLVHGAIVDVSYAFPSPADLFAYVSYFLMISGGVAFVRGRTVERHRSDLVDSMVVGAMAALLVYSFVLSDYLIDGTIPVTHRLIQLGYSLLTIAIVGVTARVSFGPGVRNVSYYLFAGAAFFIVVNDVLLLLDTVGRPGVLTAAAVVAPLGFTFAAASILHPGALQLADRPRYREQRLSTNRVLLLLLAVATGPSSCWTSGCGPIPNTER